METATGPNLMQEDFDESDGTEKRLEQEKFEELVGAHKSLEQENVALRSLNENLKRNIETDAKKNRETIEQLTAELNVVNQKLSENILQAEQVLQASPEAGTEQTQTDDTSAAALLAAQLEEELQNSKAYVEQLLTEHQELKQILESAAQIEVVEGVTSLISSIFDDSLSGDELKEQIDAQRKQLAEEELTPEVIESLMASIEELVERNEQSKQLALKLEEDVSAANDVIKEMIPPLQQMAQEPAEAESIEAAASSSETMDLEASSEQTTTPVVYQIALLTEELTNAKDYINQLLAEQQEFESLIASNNQDVTGNQELKQEPEPVSQMNAERELRVVEEVNDMILIMLDDSLTSAEFKERIDAKIEKLKNAELMPEVIEPLLESMEKLVHRSEESLGTTEKLASAERRNNYLFTRLKYASDHLRRLRTKIRQIEFASNLSEQEMAAAVHRSQELGIVEKVNDMILNMLDDSLTSAEFNELIDAKIEELKNAGLMPEAIEPLLESMEKFVDRSEEFLGTTEKLASAERRNNYLFTRLQYASDHLRRLRTKIRNFDQSQEEFLGTNEKLATAEQRNNYLFTRLQYASDHLRRLRVKIRNFELASSLSEQEIAAAVERSKNLERLLADAEERYELIQTTSASQAEELMEAIAQLRQISQSKDIAIRTLQSELEAITLKTDILFDSASIELKPEGIEALLKIASIINNFSAGRVVSIEGHTDNKALRASLAQLIPSNWELSTHRAASAARFLIANGIPAEDVRIVGHGEQKPIASNDSEQGRAANRRIEILLVPRLKPQLLDVEAN